MRQEPFGTVRTDKKTYIVTASGGNYYLDGVLTPSLNAYRGGTYIFDYTGATSHPFKFSTTSDGTHGGGSEYTDVSAIALWQIVICFFYCTGA